MRIMKEPRYLYLPRFPSVNTLWANLAEARRLRWRMTLDADYANFFGIPSDKAPEVIARLRIREAILERKLK